MGPMQKSNDAYQPQAATTMSLTGSAKQSQKQMHVPSFKAASVGSLQKRNDVTMSAAASNASKMGFNSSQNYMSMGSKLSGMMGGGASIGGFAKPPGIVPQRTFTSSMANGTYQRAPQVNMMLGGNHLSFSKQTTNVGNGQSTSSNSASQPFTIRHSSRAGPLFAISTIAEDEDKKVAVFGACGQMGNIHAGNLVIDGHKVMAVDLPEFNKGKLPFFSCKDDLKKLVDDGYESCIISIPETFAAKEAIRAMEAGFKKILLDKPGAPSSSELVRVQTAAKEHNVKIFMNYQRALDPLLAEKLKEIEAKKKEGYQLNYVSVYSCDKAQPPQAAPQPLNQACHDFSMVLQILEAGGDQLTPATMRTEGINWETTSDTQYMVCTGQAHGLNDQKCLYEVKCGRVSSTGTFTDILVQMSKYDAQQDMYIPFDIRLRYPFEPDENAFWSDVWKESFIKVKSQFVKSEPQGLADLEIGIKTLRMAELSNISLKQGGKEIKNITLSANQYPEKTKWITMGSLSFINEVALVDAMNQIDGTHVVGCMQGYDEDPAVFIDRYPQTPAITFDSLDQLKQVYGKGDALAFYYPAVPSQKRDDRIVEVLDYFPNSICLGEKPSHGNADTAKAFKKALEDRNIDTNRFMVGMHAPLHPSRVAILDFLKNNKDKYAVETVDAYNHYPKDPTNVNDGRIFDPNIGGALLDLGVYLIQQCDEIAELHGFDFQTVIDQGDKMLVDCRKNPEGIDLETTCKLKYNINESNKPFYDGMNFKFSCKVNPGTDEIEEQIIYLRSKSDGTLSKLNFSKMNHPADSIGLFLEHADGTVEKLMGKEPKTSYAYQIEMCNQVLKDLVDGKKPEIPCKYLTLDYQIKILEIIDQLKKM